MRIVKEIKTTHPTVQYGNVDILTRYEYDSVSDTLSKEDRIRLKKADDLLNRTVVSGWSDLRDYVEDSVKGKLGRISTDVKKEKPKIGKEKIRRF